MKAYSHESFTFPLPEEHRFPIQKYHLLRQRLVEQGVLAEEDIAVAEPASRSQLELVHLPEYVAKVFEGALSEKETRRIGFPWSTSLVERARRSVGGTIAACRSALQEGIAANLAGGTHHAYPDHGEGYCVFNDVAVAARLMLREGRAQGVVILDCDVHQGNGTAAIFANDPSVYTFSIHGQKNFPFHKETSRLDISLPDATSDEEYLRLLKPGLEQAIEQSAADLAIYLAGADPFIGDRLGRMALSKAGLAQRDRMALEMCEQAGLPVAVTMSGGYAHEVQDIVDIHTQTIRLAQATWLRQNSPGAALS